MPINKLVKFQKDFEDLTKSPDTYSMAEIQALANDVDDLLLSETKDKEFTELKDMVAHLTQKVNMLEQMFGANDLHAFREALRGRPGKDADENKITSNILTRLPRPRDGKDADENRIVARITARMPKPKDDSVLKLEIEELKRKLEELENRVKNRLFAPGPKYAKQFGGGGGVFSAVETPSGAVNSSNVSFTVTATPQYIIVDGVTYFEGNGYSRSGSTLTLSVPPTLFIRSVS